MVTTLAVYQGYYVYTYYWYYQLLLNVILVLAVLKRNYTNLCHCLPQDYMKTISKLRLLGLPDNVLSNFTNLPTTECINDAIVVAAMIVTIKSDVQALQFCDIMDKLVDSKSSESCIEILRKGNWTEKH